MKKTRKPQSAEDLVVLDPDRYHLDIEAVYQPRLARMYSDKLADAKTEVEYAKARLKFVSAKVYRDIQQHPSKYAIDGRVTEKSIENAINVNSKQRKAERNLIEAKKKVYELEGIYEQVKERLYSIQILTKLHGQAYYSVPRITAKEKEAYEEYLKKHMRKNSIHRRD